MDRLSGCSRAMFRASRRTTARQASDNRQTGGGVALAVARLVFVHRHVEHQCRRPMRASAFSIARWERTVRPKRSAEGLALSRQ